MNPATEEIFARIIAIGLVLTVMYFLIRPIVRAIREKKPIRQLIINWIIVSTILVMQAITIPNYLKFDAPLYNRYLLDNLYSIRKAQEEYHSEHGVYAGGPNAFALLDWKPSSWRSHLFFWMNRPQPNHAFFCGDDYIRNPTGEAIPRSARPAITASSDDAFTCTAVGNIEGDPKREYWLVNNRLGIYVKYRLELSERVMQDLFSTDPNRARQINLGQAIREQQQKAGRR